MAKLQFFSLNEILMHYCLILDRSWKFFHPARRRLCKRAFEPAQDPVGLAER